MAKTRGIVGDSKFINSALTVDDDPLLSSILKSFFTNLNVPNIYQANNGHEALDLIEQVDGAIDFILCDLQMPKMDGIQFLRYLSKSKFKGCIAILSGSDKAVVSLAERLAESHDLDIRGTLEKPLNYEALRQLILNIKNQYVNDKTINSYHFTEEELHDALMAGEFVNFYQPKVDVSTEKMVGTETLVRWKHPDWGIISPDYFMPMIENCGLTSKLTNLVVDQTIEDAKRWKRLKYNIKSAINLSVSSLNDVELPSQLARKVEHNGLNKEHFIIEVTENKVLQQTPITLEVLARLRMSGFELSIDDFGTGYSNIERLREFPFNELKIDQSFVRRSSSDELAKSIVENCAKLGQDLGMRLVAEGIETDDDRRFVSSLGVDLIQGYYYAKPMPVNELFSWFFDSLPRNSRASQT